MRIGNDICRAWFSCARTERRLWRQKKSSCSIPRSAPFLAWRNLAVRSLREVAALDLFFRRRQKNVFGQLKSELSYRCARKRDARNVLALWSEEAHLCAPVVRNFQRRKAAQLYWSQFFEVLRTLARNKAEFAQRWRERWSLEQCFKALCNERCLRLERKSIIQNVISLLWEDIRKKTFREWAATVEWEKRMREKEMVAKIFHGECLLPRAVGGWTR